ncbi:unnamed protein product, partial [Prunus brigantina]
CLISNVDPSSTAGYVMQPGPQNIKTAEKSLAVKEPAANFAPCVSSLKIAKVLDQTETIAELLNMC